MRSAWSTIFAEVFVGQILKRDGKMVKMKNTWSKVIHLPASLRPRIEALAKADHRTTKSWLEKIILEAIKGK
jgi:hypothetical protein